MLANGDKYEGQFENGLKHGRGVITFANGRRYEGELRNGEPYGLGT